MQETILVPLDGSSAAQVVLPYAEEFAARLGADIILVSVSESKAADLDHLYLAYLERIKEQVQSELKDFGAEEEAKVYSEVLPGNPAEEILRYANEIKTGLIAMASRGSSGRGPWLLGNIAAKVLRATGKGVLLIRAPAKSTALKQKRLVKRILLPLDGSPVGETALPYTETLALALNAELVLLQVLEPITSWSSFGVDVAYDIAPEIESRKASAIAYLNGMRKRLTEKGLSISGVTDTGAPADRIIAYAEANDIDLIAMSTHGRSGIGRWVFGSVTDKILHTGNTPVLVIRTSRA